MRGDAFGGGEEPRSLKPSAGQSPPLRIEKLVYGGDGLAHAADGAAHLLPHVLLGELVEVLPELPVSDGEPAVAERSPVRGLVSILERSGDRVEPGCVHFGVCGGCQYQMASYPAQLRTKGQILRELLDRAGLVDLPAAQTWASPEAYGYRNRIRLRVREVGGALRLGYNLRGSREFLPIRMCPIAAPVLWDVATALEGLAGEQREAARWLAAAAEVEIFCTADEARVQVNLLCAGQPPRDAAFARYAEALAELCPALSGMGAARLDARSGRALAVLAGWGSPGLLYPVLAESYWVTRGGFFQVNRFLLPRLVELVCGDPVCGNQSGAVAWDLFAGVGLFSRVLARRFAAVTAVEAHAVSCGDLRAALAKLGPAHRAVEATAVDFLRRAMLQRERPDLIVLDPPRAGAGEEACVLMARLGPRQIVYLSCDPTTLARDLAVLTRSGYRVAALHLIDLFPQTYHLETLAVLDRTA